MSISDPATSSSHGRPHMEAVVTMTSGESCSCLVWEDSQRKDPEGEFVALGSEVRLMLANTMSDRSRQTNSSAYPCPDSGLSTKQKELGYTREPFLRFILTWDQGCIVGLSTKQMYSPPSWS
eukprot:TRINITY_DN5470_c0_g1_i1.p2 TRINITY_DN5470_c0_g1~~TRINITY_DN5470_c0_g1_i1.p2  ORF type:complete len:122 (+),score=4.79 TRINITY_DN5470_c0_g1_i1:151-516(+)